MKRSSVAFGAEFGAMARGTLVPGVTTGAVVPPGRYWLDSFGDKRQVFLDWLKGKPEVHLESSEEDEDTARLFAIFVIPPTATNFGLPGVLFPTVTLGFPETADTTVQTSDDTVIKPTALTSAQIIADAAGAAGQATGSLVQGVTSGLSTGTFVKVGAAAVVTLIVLKKLAFL